MSKKSLNSYLKKALTWWLVGVLASLILVYFFTLNTGISYFNYMNTGQIGDTIGGISSPFIGVAAAVLTFLAFYMQFKANEMHSKQFSEQKTDAERDKKEDTILFLIKQNRSIAESMSIGKTVAGTRCFVKMYKELRVIFEIAKSFYENELQSGELTLDDISNISYLILFNGIGQTSDPLNEPLLSHFSRSNDLLNTFRNIYQDSLGIWRGFEFVKTTIDIAELLNELEYFPFDGHLTRLSHYFRNLFHTLKYTELVDVKLLSKDDKYEIIKTLRSQLTNYEQIIIYFNAISSYGTPMRRAKHIETYKLIKNIPLPHVSFAGNIKDRFPGLEFEWEEIIARARAMSN